MNVMGIKSLIRKISYLWAKRSSESYCRYLRRMGVSIGEGTFIFSRNALIDISRPSLVSIGKDCYINQHFTLLTHEWVSKVFIGSGRGFLNSSGKVTIGNNVSFGQNVMVLKGVSIGDNCFIGAGSIVTKDIPAGSIAVGAPCRVIMTLDEYYEKRLAQAENEAFEYVRSIQARFGRAPRLEEMTEEFIWFVDGKDIDKYPMLPIRSQLGDSYDEYAMRHKAKYNGFEDFLKAAGMEL